MQERNRANEDPSAPGGIDRVRERIEDILAGGEEIHHLVTQRRMPRNLVPSTVAMTNRRLILYRPRLFGRVAFEHHPWRNLRGSRLREGLLSSTLTLDLAKGDELAIGCLPKPEARRLYGYAQDRVDRVREEQEARESVGRRALAGGGTPVDSGDGDRGAASSHPFHRLRELTAMRDAGLITPEEYERKRAEILSRM